MPKSTNHQPIKKRPRNNHQINIWFAVTKSILHQMIPKRECACIEIFFYIYIYEYHEVNTCELKGNMQHPNQSDLQRFHTSFDKIKWDAPIESSSFLCFCYFYIATSLMHFFFRFNLEYITLNASSSKFKSNRIRTSHYVN